VCYSKCHNIEKRIPRALLRALQHQVSRGDTNKEVVVFSATQHMPQNRVSDIIMHVMLNTINVVCMRCRVGVVVA
jgi:hypothetical protein